MPYISPSGWIEPLLTAGGADRGLRRFHLRKDCPASNAPRGLIATHRTDDAQPCSPCAR
jgi:hypothetical protein